jgi:hypothetical protein
MGMAAVRESIAVPITGAGSRGLIRRGKYQMA